jgi:glutamate-1-semialdehyde aminotransferase
MFVEAVPSVEMVRMAGSGAATFGVPDSTGVPGDFARLTLTAEYNSLESVKALVLANKGNVACVIAKGNLQSWPLPFARFFD